VWEPPREWVGDVSPDGGMAAAVPAVDECTDLDHQLADRGEGATVDDLAFNDPEPDLDEVEPRPEVGVKWMWMRKFAAMVSKAPPGPPGRCRPMRTRTPQCAFIHRAVPNARCPCRSWAAAIVSELAAASLPSKRMTKQFSWVRTTVPPGRSRYRDVPVATTASLSTAT
jgi:hypothetical protein